MKNNLVIGVLVCLLVVGAAGVFYVNTLTPSKSYKPVPTPTGKRNLQLETFNLTPTPADMAVATDDISNPGMFPTKPVTPFPTEKVNSGCVGTIGYWKNHAGFGPQQVDLVKPLLPIWLGLQGGAKSVHVTSNEQAVDLLNMNYDSSNGINKLYAQFLAAKLSFGNGAAQGTLPVTLTDEFLATHNQNDWSTLTASDRQKVQVWIPMYNDYNTGATAGLVHCQ